MVTGFGSSAIPISPKIPIAQKFSNISAPIQSMPIYCAPSSSNAEFNNSNIISQLVQVQDSASAWPTSSRNVTTSQQLSTIVQYSQNTSSTFTMYHTQQQQQQQQQFDLNTNLLLNSSNSTTQPLAILPKISSTTNSHDKKNSHLPVKSTIEVKQKQPRQRHTKNLVDSSLQQVRKFFKLNTNKNIIFNFFANI